MVVPGEETKSTPTFADKDGKDAKAPEGSKFKITDGFTAPEGYEVSIDENTGEITVKFPDDSKLDKDTVEEFDVPVTVTYPDKTTDEVKANFKLDTDGDGKPDTEDEDDDNDGISDKEEKTRAPTRRIRVRFRQLRSSRVTRPMPQPTSLRMRASWLFLVRDQVDSDLC